MNRETQNGLWARIERVRRNLTSDEARLEQILEQSVQAEEKPTPKFKVGDKVTMVGGAKISYNGVGTIIEVHSNHGYTFYRIKEHPALFSEQYLESYTEPKFKIGDKFRFRKNPGEIHTVHSICADGKICFYEKDEDGLNKQCLVNAEYIELYTEPEPRQTEEDMEEKELNLLTLLKGCEGEKFYSPNYGEIELIEISPLGSRPLKWQRKENLFHTFSDGRIYSNSEPTIFPSRDLFLKYPLESAKAWEIWKSERTPKRWRAKKGEEYYWFSCQGYLESDIEREIDTDDLCYSFGNYFKTLEQCKEAAEAVKRTLEEFHTNHHNTDRR